MALLSAGYGAAKNPWPGTKGGAGEMKNTLLEESKLAFSDKELAGYDAAREAKYGGGSNNLSLLGDDEEDTLSEVDTWF